MLDRTLERLLALMTRHGEARIFVLSLVVSELITAILVVPLSALFGAPTSEYLVVGAITCLVTASLVLSTIFALVRRIRRAEAERERLHEQLVASQRLEALGKLAGGIAHDFNNIIGGVLGNVSYLRDIADDAEAPTLADDAVREVLHDVDGACRRAADLTRQLVTFARAEPTTTAVIDVGELIEEVGRLVRRTAGRSVHVEVVRAAGVCADVDPSQLHQVLLNLCVNARDALVGPGTIRLSVAAAQGWLTILVEDDGPGMDPGTCRRAFEPFFTTNGAAGSGLGLAVVHGVVARHGGRVELDSEPGRGTRVRVMLPRSDERPEEAAPARSTSAPMGTLLVVDDEPGMRAAVARMASGLGWEVVKADSGDAALRTYLERGDTIDCVVLDMVMPNLGGLETFRRLRAADADVRVVAMSGHDERGDGVTLLAEGGRGYLRKPFGVDQLSAALTEAMVVRQPAVAATSP